MLTGYCLLFPGVSIGSIKVYKKLFDRAIASILEFKKNTDKCLIDDQGIIAWIYAKEDFPISLDFKSSLFATTQLHRLRDYKFDNFTGNFIHIRSGMTPNTIHFAGK